MPDTFSCEIQARLRDINVGGHVDNVEAIRVVEEARIRFFGHGTERRSGLLAPVPIGVADLVASQRVDYRAEMRFAPMQSFLVRMWIGHVGRSSFTVQSEVRTAVDHPPAVVAETSVVMWSREDQASWELSPGLRSELERYQGEPVALQERR